MSNLQLVLSPGSGRLHVPCPDLRTAAGKADAGGEAEGRPPICPAGAPCVQLLHFDLYDPVKFSRLTVDASGYRPTLCWAPFACGAETHTDPDGQVDVQVAGGKK